MKYSQPCLHYLDSNNAEAHCDDGSGASITHECTEGNGFSVSPCNAGGVPPNNCNAGIIPGTCSPTGTNVEVACLTGTGPV